MNCLEHLNDCFSYQRKPITRINFVFYLGILKILNTARGSRTSKSMVGFRFFLILTTPTKSQVIQTPHWPPLTNIKETQKEKCKQAQKQDLKMKKTTKTQMRQASYTCDLVAVLITHGWIQSFEPPSSQGENLSLAWLSSNPSGRLKEHSGRVKVKVNPRKKVSSRERKRNL